MPRITFLRGHEIVNVAGESHYQDALRAIVGPAAGEVRLDATAHLRPEPENEHDLNAVRVEIDGSKVGYLPRDSAAQYAPGLARIAARGRVPACEALIAGRDGAEAASLVGVFCVSRRRTTRRCRTTRHAASSAAGSDRESRPTATPDL